MALPYREWHDLNNEQLHAIAEVPLFDLAPVLERSRAQAMLNSASVFKAGRFILGKQVRSFEQELANAFGSTVAIGVGSGTAAIELCLRALRVAPDQDVIVPANTSLFTAQAVLAAGARVRFADVDPHTLQLTAETAAAAWTSSTAAIIGVHLYGNACPLGPLSDLCRERGVPLVQDACQAHGLRYQGQPLTTFSPYTAYSFYPAKNLGGVGDGGAVVTSSPELADHFRLLRDGGRDSDQWARIPAINSRLSELQAACLRAFLPHLEHWNMHRRRIAQVYEEAFRGVPGVTPVPHEGESVHHLYVIRTARRDELREHLRSTGIETAVHYPNPLHQHPAFAVRGSWAAEPCEAARACKEILSLPIGPHIQEDTALHVAAQVGRFFA